MLFVAPTRARGWKGHCSVNRVKKQALHYQTFDTVGSGREHLLYTTAQAYVVTLQYITAVKTATSMYKPK